MTTVEDPPVKVRLEVDAEADPTHHMEPRLRARRIEIRKAARRHRRRLIISLLAVLVLVGVAAGALYSPLLQVRSIHVTGERHLTESDLIDASKLHRGDRLIDIDSDAVARRIGRQPWVRRVAVERRWPDGMSIKVVERAALATVATTSGGRLVIATDGRVAGLAGPFDQALPTVTLPATLQVRIGTVLPKPVAAAVEMLNAMPDDIILQSTGAKVSAKGDLTLTLKPAGELWFGDARHVRQKILSAQTILGGSVSLRNLKRLDVRIPSAPTVLQGG